MSYNTEYYRSINAQLNQELRNSNKQAKQTIQETNVSTVKIVSTQNGSWGKVNITKATWEREFYILSFFVDSRYNRWYTKQVS